MMISFQDAGRLPTPEDNCAIATRLLPAGTAVESLGDQHTIAHTLLEGHRFASRPIAAGSPLLSWGVPFGRALRDIAPGEYVINDRVLEELRGRSLDFQLPPEPNFVDDLATYHFDPLNFQPADPLPYKDGGGTFMGLRRPGARGVGTRNMIVLLGVNALAAGFVQGLESELKPLLEQFKNIDGIVAVAHTEGSQAGSNNQDLLLRTLSGYMVHPNVAAVLVLDAGDVGVTNGMVRDYALENGYELADVIHQFISLQGPFAADMAQTKAVVKEWLPEVNDMRRTAQPMGELKIALQCGGSDAFSGISGNPLAALVSKEIIHAGGSALLAETDELIGAESYVLDKVRDAATAERFLEVVNRFKERVAWHGYSAQGNPSGGNRYRGLYNIYLKSLGAATKRHPDVRLDYVLDYSQPMEAPGYYFMDSPGNDLESIAGQVASGCNLIYFVTGNGSVTNFPFVPTIKIVTTSERFRLLPQEMDVNAGAYLDGTPLEILGKSTLDLTLAIASGQRSAGELAGHSQVQVWRNWPQTGYVDLQKIKERPQPDGVPIPVKHPQQVVDFQYAAWRAGDRLSSDRVGLIFPASLCSGQVAVMAAQRLNELAIGKEIGISRFVSLVHTEGCGSPPLPVFVDPLLGYLNHPAVVTSLFLEHGCEITHNAFWQNQLRKTGKNPQQVGWASVQLDGGIVKVLDEIEAWFTVDCARLSLPETATAGFGDVRLGIISEDDVDEDTAESMALLCQHIVSAGGLVVLPENDPLLKNNSFTESVTSKVIDSATLLYANPPQQSGLHIMANPTSIWLETMTGLGATGVDLILGLVSRRSQQGHPFIPVLQAAAATEEIAFHADLDVLLSGSPDQRLRQISAPLAAVLSQELKAKLSEKNMSGFQITRGEIGVSF